MDDTTLYNKNKDKIDCPYCYLKLHNTLNKMEKTTGENFKCKKGCNKESTRNAIINKWKEIKEKLKSNSKNKRS
jgi:hypothetical protein